MNTVAIGDVHGCIQLLQQTVQPLIGSQSEVVLLGDLIDRSPDDNGDLKVLQLVKFMEENPNAFGLSNVVVLSGNHEQLLLQAIKHGKYSEAYELWVWNGGNPDVYEQIDPFIDWLQARPYYHQRGDYLFVHAGVRPGVPLEKQTKSDLTWIREPFLEADHGLPYTVVHGHTIVHEVDVTHNRINLDTGAFYTGNLSSRCFTIPS